MTVGETLSAARSGAGLSVDDLSEITKIRGTVIRSIEQDDYDACGGDLYVRGYVRAIAGAIGIDAQPLIRAYDLQRASSRRDLAHGPRNRRTGGFPAAPPPDPALTAFDLPAVANTGPAAGDLDITRFDLPVIADPIVTSYDLPRVFDRPATAALPTAQFDDLMAAGYDLPAADSTAAGSATNVLPAIGAGPAAAQPASADTARFDSWQNGPVLGGPVPGRPVQGGPVPSGPVQGGPAWGGPGQPAPGQPAPGHGGPSRGRRRGLLAVSGIVVLIAVVLIGVRLATGKSPAKATASSTANASASAAAQASASAQAAAAASASSAQASASSASASKSASAKAAAQRVVPLTIASVAAYGPGGFADGDNAENAQYAIGHDAAQPWQSQWYTTPQFGGLKRGTGLLLDLGRKVTVTKVRVALSPYQGTDLQIRVGGGTAFQDLVVAGTADNVGGTVTLTLRHPATGRYLLLWFTQLPPDGSGHYQESVSHVVVTGRR